MGLNSAIREGSKTILSTRIWPENMTKNKLDQRENGIKESGGHQKKKSVVDIF